MADHTDPVPAEVENFPDYQENSMEIECKECSGILKDYGDLFDHLEMEHGYYFAVSMRDYYRYSEHY